MAFDHILLQGAYVFQCSELLEPYPVIEPTRNVVVNASDVDEDYVQCEHDQTRGAFSDADQADNEAEKTTTKVRMKYIYYQKASNKYQVNVTKDKKLHRVGCFPTQEEAVLARDAFMRGKTVAKPVRAVAEVKEGPHGRCITYNKARNKYMVYVTKGKKQHYVGSFPTQEEAVVARDTFLRNETATSPTHCVSAPKRKYPDIAIDSNVGVESDNDLEGDESEQRNTKKSK